MLQVAQNFGQIGLTVVSQFPQCPSINELHGDEVLTNGRADLVNVCDVWMIESSSGLCFLNEAAHAIPIRSNLPGKHFERNLAMQLHVFRQVNLAHSAGANLRADFIATKSCAWGKGGTHLRKWSAG